MRISIEPRKYLEGCGFLSFAKNIVKTLSNKYSQKLLDSAIKSTSKRATQKTAEATDDLIGNKTAHKITSVLKKKSTKDYIIMMKQKKMLKLLLLRRDTYLQKKDNKLLRN